MSRRFRSPFSAVRKRFRAAFHVLICLCLVCSCASAERIPRFETFPEALSFLRQCVSSGREEVLFLLPAGALEAERPLLEDRGAPGFDLDDSLWNLLYALPEVFALSYGTARNGDDLCVRLGFVFRDGFRLEKAYRSGDLSALTEEERSALRAALEIALEAGKKQTDAEKLRALCALLCARIRFALPGDGRGREKSCLGALNGGTANCQGYSDAFYLAASLMGFEAGYQNGTVRSTGEVHTWNTLTLNGKKGYTDLTWMDHSEGADERQRFLTLEELLPTRIPYPFP